MTADDVESKAQVHAQTWHETYRGMIPDAIVDRITPQFALKVTRKHFPDGSMHTLLAFDGDRLVGFAEYSVPARVPSDDLGAAELDSIYVLASDQGKGAGRLLLEAVIGAVPAERLVLWAFASNAKALAFYRHMGFHETGRTQDEDNGASHEVELVNFDEHSHTVVV